MALKHIETTVLETTVRMRYADNADPTKAREWFAFEVPISELKVPEDGLDMPLEKLNARYLGSIRQAALLHVQRAISAEIPRIVTR